MCNTLLFSKHGYFSSFLFRARQACNQMQFIYRNGTTSTDHDRVSSLVWDKTPFMVSLKGRVESISLWEVSVRVGSFYFETFGVKLTQLVIKRANVDLDCWGQTACCEGTSLQGKYRFLFYFMLASPKDYATLSPVNYVQMQRLHNELLPLQCERYRWTFMEHMGKCGCWLLDGLEHKAQDGGLCPVFNLKISVVVWKI